MPDLSIEEANKIRLSMGLPALPGSGGPASSGPAFKPATEGTVDDDDEPASTIETREAAGYDNWKKLQDEAEAKKKREERAAAIKRDRERAARFAKLEGKGLADEANEDDDMAWLKSSKKRQKKIAQAEQMQRDLEERERQEREAMQYTEADLAGVKVGHEIDQFDDQDQILVLKDTAVDAEDDDELEAVSLKERERLQERLDSKKRKRAYDPNDMDEAGQTSILAQYDEEIDGKKTKAFTLDGQGRTVEDARAEAAGASKPKKVAISLDILKDDAPANDYMDVSEVKMKKPKKKKAKKAKREHIEDEEDMFTLPTEAPADDMDIDAGQQSAPKSKKKSMFDESFIDDDDLQVNLAAQRQKALKKRKKMKPEDIARQVREDASAPPEDVMESTEGLDEPALVIDETTEFVANLGANAEEAAEEEARRKRRKSSHMSSGIKSMGDVPHEDSDGDIDMAQSYAEAAEAEDARTRSISRARSTDITDTGLEAEKTVDQGLGATLALLKQRGLVAATAADDKNAHYRDRQKFLADKLKAEADAERQRKLARERERGSTRWNTMTPREREEWARKQNTSADMFESRRLADIFNKEYKPNVELSYVDEHGRQMNQKEAFKQLSHQFHGKGSGNTKTKKYLDKVEAEKKKMAESSLEAGKSGGGGLGNALSNQAKKNKTAGVRLL
ncbi:DNA binding protein-like protein SART-1 [Plenodomus tracheiphilus IPT5]|uniref:DNA binding protein-like protein SART-1 n=1 Tax=Plenodomus tracheiphilus IPT5 TaxID=1408161 RepID=A0A6A7AYH7_9PLEO|nr:DNA binding protein-like protein SART-1 [Plenodomus tracheiphilus IPT5]